jgi:hypothetical protein
LEDTPVSTFHSLSPPARLSPVGRLDRLRHTLDDVSGHLVEGIADAAAQAVAAAIRDAVLTLLRADGQHAASPRRDRLEARPDLRPSLWGEVDEPDESDEPWEDQEEGPWSESPGRRSFSTTLAPAATPRPQVRSWLTALSAGWRAGRWWLRSRPGRLPLLAALGVGLAGGAAAFLVGALLPAGVGLLDSALNLAALADLAHAGSAVLAAAL